MGWSLWSNFTRHPTMLVGPWLLALTHLQDTSWAPNPDKRWKLDNPSNQTIWCPPHGSHHGTTTRPGPAGADQCMLHVSMHRSPLWQKILIIWALCCSPKWSSNPKMKDPRDLKRLATWYLTGWLFTFLLEKAGRFGRKPYDQYSWAQPTECTYATL